MQSQNWEYEVFAAGIAKEGFIVRPELDPVQFKNALNHFGAQGWELVSVFDVNMVQGGTKQVIATFKRPAKDALPPPMPG